MNSRSNHPKAKILCVDDDRNILHLYTRFLEQAGYEVQTAPNASQGFEAALDFRPDLIVSDVVMPEETGYDFCRRVRNHPDLAKCIFILSSAQLKDSDDAIKGLDEGADDYLYKPVRRAALLAKIRNFVRIKQLQDSLVATNRKLNETVGELKIYKAELERKNAELNNEKQILENSLKQISLLVKEREATNQQLEALNRTREDNFQSLITILATLQEAKRQYHRGHTEKVAEIASFIATQLQLAPSEVEDIEIASRLHEIGKLALPDELTMKNPEAYTERDRGFLSQHPVKGADLLENYAGFQNIARIIRHYHENIDGTGIPDGLKGEAIPIGSRIIALAGIFDNIVYRKKGGTIDEAFQVIEAKAGSRFDPQLVFYLHKYAMAYPPDDTPNAMKAVSLYDLKPGMILAAGVFSKNGMKLLPLDSVLSEASIGQIAQYHRTDPLEEIVFIRID